MKQIRATTDFRVDEDIFMQLFLHSAFYYLLLSYCGERTVGVWDEVYFKAVTPMLLSPQIITELTLKPRWESNSSNRLSVKKGQLIVSGISPWSWASSKGSIKHGSGSLATPMEAFEISVHPPHLLCS